MLVHVESRDFVAWLEHVEKSIENQVVGTASALAQEAGQQMNQHGYQNRTGKLTASMHWRTARTGGMGFLSIVEIGAPYAVFVDLPTKAHKIEARRAPMLVFFWRGEWHRRKSVWHPGTRGAHFSTRAADFYRNVCSIRFQRAVDSAITGSG